MTEGGEMAGIKSIYEGSLPILNLGVELEGAHADREGRGEKQHIMSP